MKSITDSRAFLDTNFLYAAPYLALGLCWFRLVHLFLYQTPLQGVSESLRKRRARGKRRDADTGSSQKRLIAITLPHQKLPR